MESHTYYYAVVPARDQGLGRQIAAFRTLSVNGREIITDEDSQGTERAGYQTLKNSILKRGDTLVVKSLDRLSRNNTEIPDELRFFRERGVRVKIMDLPTTMTDFSEDQKWGSVLVQNLLIELCEALLLQEGSPLRSRRDSGTAATKKQGRGPGRPPITFPDNWTSVYAAWKAGKITAKTAMEKTGTKRTSFYKLVRMMEKR